MSPATTPFPVELASPWALWLLLFLPVWWILRKLRRPATITFSRADVIARGPKARNWYPKLLFALRNLLFILLILALARPRVPKKPEKIQDGGINIVLLIDLSSSMLSQDFQPRNRLEVAKASMRQFIESRRSDRVGLVGFAAEPYTVTPVTTNYAVLLQSVDSLRVGQLDDGTAIGDAIVAGAGRLYKAPGKSKVMILLTDGVNNRGTFDPLTGARAASAYGIKIYTIGVGKSGVAPVPVPGPDSIPQLETMPVEVDEELLTEVAQATGGQYFRAVDGAALGRIYRQINSMERSVVQTTSNVPYTELFRWPLAAAVVLLVLELSISAVRAPLP